MGGSPSRVTFGINQVIPILVLPIAICSAVKLIHYGVTQRCFTQILPLLIIQVNSIFIWICQGYFFLYVPYVSIQTPSFKNQAIYSMLNGSIFLEPINTFLYTWNFLETLQQDSQGRWLTTVKLSRQVSLYFIPFAYVTLYTSLVIVWSKFLLTKDQGNQKEYDESLTVAKKIFSTIGYFSTFTNVLSCVIMGFVVRYVKQQTQISIHRSNNLQSQDENKDQRVQMNIMVTAMHITMIVAYTIISILNDNVYAGTFGNSLFRVATSFVFFSGLLDIFVAYMVWFVLQAQKDPLVIMTDQRYDVSYPVLDVVKEYKDEVDEVEVLSDTSFEEFDRDNFNASLISSLMVGQFFQNVESDHVRFATKLMNSER